MVFPENVPVHVHHHHHHHPQISWWQKSRTKLQGRSKCRIRLVSMVLLPVVCAVVRSVKQFRLSIHSKLEHTDKPFKYTNNCKITLRYSQSGNCSRANGSSRDSVTKKPRYRPPTPYRYKQLTFPLPVTSSLLLDTRTEISWLCLSNASLADMEHIESIKTKIIYYTNTDWCLGQHWPEVV